MGKFLFEDGQKVVFMGDSITDCGRRDNFFPFGNGYVKMTIDLIVAKYIERNITYFNKGISGDTMQDLYNRWHDDVLVQKPNWVSIKIGINDILTTLMNHPVTVPLDRFGELYNNILEQTKKKTKAKLVLIDPFYISKDTDSQSFRRKVLDYLTEYIAVVHKMAARYNAILVRTHECFMNQLKYKSPDYFCPEPVHPNASGHLVIAHELLKKLHW